MPTIAHLGSFYPAVPDLFHRLRVILSRMVPRRAARYGYQETTFPLESCQQVSILFTDIVGFSEMMSAWPLERFVASLNAYFERLSPCIYRHGGQVDKFLGDGLLAVFPSPDDAVGAARSVQREVAVYNARQTGRRCCAFPTRIVVDTGPAIRTALGLGRDRKRTVMGPVVNSASHLVKTLPPDKVFISHATCCRLANRADLWLTVAQAADRQGNRTVIYEVPCLERRDIR